ncbi:MAG: hypothetical protein HKN10_20365 [Myxococcales bacterium]|nr:hypothetical protein [Deltaproteobacteria bacterium]NNE20831.1 hypothetical protein [Myxococcales bacterium]
MSGLAQAWVVAAVIMTLGSACATGRVRGAQGTEMQQEQAYEPSSKVDPPQGNVDRTSGPVTLPTPPPALEIDLERRPPAPGPELEPEPEPEPTTGNDPK